ncbi:tyrosine-type recombinase/integrase [Catellatospora coxensis]|uniref:Tyrosine recombinase XerC n=1 Tax=Catellatospora coxensis TaxID=310354 RepID=A0A8J3PB33_9ACTN|nr:tyrosine-type recombinase/integrase [Catellatospora coxensis]GIG10234.1 tyrosine recombinase XerC [Catellatospora coxensis]
MNDDPNEITFASYERALVAKHLSERTIQSYTESLGQLAEFVDDRDLLELDTADIEDWMGYLLEHRAATTAGVRFRSVRAFYRWAVKKELIAKSPMEGMEEPKPDDEPVPVLGDDHLRALLKACQARGKKDLEGVRDEAIIRIFCEPGSPRVSELAGILLDSVDLGRTPRIGVMGKGRKVRTIPLGVKAAEALGAYVRLRRGAKGAERPELWLGAKRGTPMTSSGVQQMLERRSQQAGVPHTRAHQLRHTSAHNWKLAGGSEEDSEYLFGWTPGSGMARRYARSAGIDRAQQAARKASIGDRL